MRRLLLTLGIVCLSASAIGQELHGAGDPRQQSPIPDCRFKKTYVDDTTGTLYTASGYPCVWGQGGGSAPDATARAAAAAAQTTASAALPAAGALNTLLPGVTSAGTGSISASGAVAAGATAPSGTTGLWGIASQGELNAAAYISPAAAVAAACASNSKAIYFPSQVYTSGLPITCSGLHIRCAARDEIASGGTIFRITGANWGLYNPNSEVTTGNNGIRNITVENCAFDISTDPTNVLGAWRIKGVNNSHFTNNAIFADNNSNPAVTEDGSNWNYNGGDYGNDFIGNILYDNSDGTPPGPPSNGIGWYLTSCSTYTGCAGQAVSSSNENHHWGGSVVRFGTSVRIEASSSNTFSQIDGENWWKRCVDLSSATNNKFDRFRCEEYDNTWAAGTIAVRHVIIDANGNAETVSIAGTTGSSAPAWAPVGLNDITNSTGCFIVGSVGQTVLLTNFNNGASTATATGTLTQTNTLVHATWAITNNGGTITSFPTSATCSAGTVTSASGVAVLTTSVGTLGQTTVDGGVTWTLTEVLPTSVSVVGGYGNQIDVYQSGFSTYVNDTTGWNNYSPGFYGSPAQVNSFRMAMLSGQHGQLNLGINKIPAPADGYLYGGLDVHGEIQSDRQINLCNFTTGCPDAGGGYASLQFTGIGHQAYTLPATGGQLALAGGGVTQVIPGTSNVTVTPSGGTGAVTVSVSPGAIIVPISYAAGDLACAVAADTTIGAITITSDGGSTGTTEILNFSGNVPSYYSVGQVFGITGATPSGIVGGPYTVTAKTSTQLTFTIGTAVAWTSGGTAYLWCGNQGNNAVSATPYTFNNATPATTFVAGSTFQVRGQLAQWESSAGPTQIFLFNYHTTSLYESGGISVPTSLPNGREGELSFDVNAVGSNLLETTLQSTTLDTTVGANYWVNSYNLPVTATSGPYTFNMEMYFSAATAGNAVMLRTITERQ